MAEELGLSKTQAKRALKRQRIEEKYRQQKGENKNKKHNEKESQNEGPKIVDGIRAIRQERNAMIRADFESKCEFGPIVVIDCDWGDKMSDKETLSLIQQIMYSYSTNKNSETPVRLWVVGASPRQQELLRKLPGFDSWHVIVTGKTLVELGLSADAVYLTADSEDVLHIEDMNRTSTLIIGGIVDRNRYKNATLLRAEEIGMRTAQLPIGEFMSLKTSKVLTVNHVVHILVDVLGHHDWKRALDNVIPDRKRDEADNSPS
jgi:tRNA (guanine9-N1)-methyltransferase